MAKRLGTAARQARERAGLTLMDIANRAGVSQSTVLNFEQGGRWVQRVDDIVDAYEHETGLEADELWRRALQQPR
jgi:transcriptional regulator with XRE-family HTH domain